MMSKRSRFSVSGTDQFPILQLDEDELNDVIETHGQCCVVRPMLPCPCRRGEMATPDIRCTSCNGTGRLYPVALEEPAMVLLLSRTPRGEAKPVASVDMADAQATFTLPTQPGDGDMVLPDGEVHVVTQQIRRTVTEVTHELLEEEPEAGLPGLAVIPPTPAKELLIYSGAEIGAVYWYDRPNKRAVAAHEGEYDLVGREFRWRDGFGPPPGVHYSIRYRAPAAYIVKLDPALYRQDGGARVPFRCAVMRLDKYAVRDSRTDA